MAATRAQQAPEAGPEPVGRRRADPLSASEAILWTIERDPVLRSTILVVAVLDRPPDATRLRARVQRAIEQFPRLRQHVVADRSGQLRWVDVDHLDVDQHLRRIRLPAPGGMRQLLDLAGPMAGAAIDPARPLWEMTVVEGLADATADGGGAGTGAAVIIKLHHVVTDGVGGIGLLDLFADLSPDADADAGVANASTRTTGAVEARSPKRTTLERGTALAVSALMRPDRVVAGAPRMIRSVVRLLAPAARAMSPLAVRRGLDRHLDVLEVSVDELAAAGHAVDGTVNDAFLAAVVGGLHRYHARHGVPVDELRVTMPISIRHHGDGPGGNRFAPARFAVPASAADPAERIAAVAAVAHGWRRDPAVGLSNLLAEPLSRLPAAVTTAVFSSMLKGVDFVATNVPGRREPAWLAGAEVVRLYGFAPPSGSALSVALVSHGATSCIGITVDTDAIADPDVLLDCVRTSFAEVAAVGGGEPPPTAHEQLAAAGRPAAEPPVHRMSTLDATFLDLESDTTPMHIGAVATFAAGALTGADGELRLAEVRAELDGRLDRSPRLRQRIASVPFALGRPVWEDDPTFDIANHVHAVHLPAPGSEAQLAAVCNELHMRVLDRSRPLWDMTFVTGVADGRVTMVHRVHHAAVDGVSSVHVFEQLMGDDEPAPMAGSQLHEPPQSALGLVVEAVGEAVGVGVHAAQAAAASLTHPKRLVATAAGLVDLLGQGLPRPHSSLNAGTVGGRRLLVPVRFELAAVKAAGHRHGVTVNDIVLACVTRGLRDLLLARDEPLGEPLHALVPVSVRTAGHLDRAGNEVSAVIVHLPVDERTAVRRLAAIAAQTRRLRSAPDAPALGSLLHWLDALPAALGTATAPLLHHQPLVNLVITNVPGSHRPLALLGTEIVDLVPVVPLAGNLTVGVAVLSYRGHLVVGIHADADHAGDVARLADGIRAELATLRRARPTGPR